MAPLAAIFLPGRHFVLRSATAVMPGASLCIAVLVIPEEVEALACARAFLGIIYILCARDVQCIANVPLRGVAQCFYTSVLDSLS